MLKESNKSRFDSYSPTLGTVCWSYPIIITFQIVACTFLATTFLEKTVYIIICKLVKHKESADEKISRFYIHASFISIHFSPISTQNSYSRTLCTRLRDCWLERISLLVSAITKSFAFFLMKVIYKSNSNFFSCICIASDINTHGVYITVSNSPNPLVFIWCNNIPCLSRHLSWRDKVRDLC